MTGRAGPPRPGPRRRLLAFGLDWLLILAWAALVAAVGIPLYLRGLTSGLSVTAVSVIATTVLVVPVTAWLAWLESRPAHATIGKRVLGLRHPGALGCARRLRSCAGTQCGQDRRAVDARACSRARVGTHGQ
jgi:uncharacterized RDD family membrane protein YckC